MYFRKMSLAILIFLIVAGVASGQTTGASLRGQIVDSQGALVPNASVAVINLDTGLVLKGHTNSLGEYYVPEIPAGNYQLRVESKGFKTSIESGIVLTISQSAKIDVSLATGDVSETVSVDASSLLVNTTTAELSQLIDKPSIQELPLNGRDPASLVLLSPGTTNINLTAAGYNQSFLAFPSAQGASSNGGKQGSTYYLLDGAPNNDIYQLLAGPFPNADATQEFKVITNNFSAEYGFSPAAVVSIQTRTGSNKFHGELFEFVRNNDFNAANYFTKQVNTLKRNQFGGSIGGPIRPNKLYFFGNYQATREIQASTPTFGTSLTAAERTGDFSAISTPLNDPLTGKAFPGNIIPQQRLDKIALAFAANLPVAPAGTNGDYYIQQPKVADHYNEGTGRVDYDVTPNNRISARYFSNFFLQPGAALAPNLLQETASNKTRYVNYLITDTLNIGQTAVNTITGYQSNENGGETPYQAGADGKPVCLSNFVSGLYSPAGICNTQGFQLLGASGGYEYIYQTNTNVRRANRGVSDTLLKTYKQHTLALGGTYIYNYAQDSSDYYASPQYVFYGNVTGSGLADLALGLLTSFSQGAGEQGAARGTQLAFFTQDQYQLKPNLSFSIGLRWEPNLPPAIEAGRAATYIAGEKSQVFPNAPVGAVFAGDPGVPNSIYQAHYNVFEPRIGVAWQPKDLPSTSVRAAFGLFSEPLPLSNYNHMYDNAPFAPTYYFGAGGYYGLGYVANNDTISFDTPWSSPAVNFPGGTSPFPPFASSSYVPSKSVAFTTPLSTIVTFDPKFTPPTVQSWNVSVSQRLRKDLSFEIAYVGLESYHDLVQNEVNPGVYANKGTRENPLFSSVDVIQSRATSSYNALQVHAQKIMSHGFQAGSSFTWSRTIDVSAYSSVTFASPTHSGFGVTNPFNLRSNRGPSDLNIPLVSVTDFVYTTPAWGHNGFVRAAVGGWELSGIVTFQAGTPFSVSWTSNADYSQSHVNQDRADLSSVPLQIKSGSRGNWLKHYYNVAAFQQTAPGTFGSSPRNFLHGPGFSTEDLGVSKNFMYRDRYRLQFRWEAFNAFNHTTFANPSTVVSNNGGQITSTGPIGPRLMQGAVKLYF